MESRRLRTAGPAAWLVRMLGMMSMLNGAMAIEVPKEVVADLAPTGRLRVAINFGNSVLAQRDPAGRTIAARYLRAFVEEMKSSGFVERALHESRQGEATVAAPSK